MNTNIYSDTKVDKIRGYANLPLHILLNVFEYFDEQELRNNIIPVCQQWRLAAENPILWKSLTFSGKQIETSIICEKIWRYNNVNTIHLRNVPRLTVILRQVCRCSENLQFLTLRYCSEVTEDALRHVVSTCKNLKSLDIKGTFFRSLIFYEELSCARNLTAINLSENILLTRSNILTVAVNCRKLESFHLSTFEPKNKIFLDDSDCYFILTSLMHDLKSLSLDCSTLNSYAISFILCCKNLRYLCLNYAYNFEGVHFQNIWKSLVHLTTIKVRFGHQITDLNVKHLFEEGREALEHLEVVDFTGCSKISDNGVNAIANCCTKLRTLNLRGCKNITNILPVLQNCKELEVLNIGFCESLNTERLPIPEVLKVLYISDKDNLKHFADVMEQKSSKTDVKLCVSEFNKRTVKYKYYK